MNPEQYLRDDTMVFIPSYGRLDDLKKCIRSIRRTGNPDGVIHVVCQKSLDPHLTIPGVRFHRTQHSDWNEGKAYAACMTIAMIVNPSFKYLIMIDDDVLIRTNDWTQMPVIMDFPEYEKVYAATACGDMRLFFGARMCKVLDQDGIAPTDRSYGVIIVRRAAIEEAGLFAPAPCRSEYEYKLRLALIGKVFACLSVSGFRHLRKDYGGTNRLFSRKESRKANKRHAFWLFLKSWTNYWRRSELFLRIDENILARGENRFQVYINWNKIARLKRGSLSEVWLRNIINKLKWNGRYTRVFIDWLRESGYRNDSPAV